MVAQATRDPDPPVFPPSSFRWTTRDRPMIERRPWRRIRASLSFTSQLAFSSHSTLPKKIHIIKCNFYVKKNKVSKFFLPICPTSRFLRPSFLSPRGALKGFQWPPVNAEPHPAPALPRVWMCQPCLPAAKPFKDPVMDTGPVQSACSNVMVPVTLKLILIIA